MLAPFECLCGNFILPESASYVFFYAVSNLRNLLYLINSRFQQSELDYLIYNDPVAYADLILNGDPKAYLKNVTEYKPLD